MTLLYKEDWDEAKDRLIQWWNGAYFGRTGDFPQSPSWVEAIPKQQCTLWAKEIQAGLEAATAPMMDASREMSFFSELRNKWVAGESGDRDIKVDLT